MNREEYNKYMRKWQREHPEAFNLILRRHYQKLRNEILSLLGSKCIRCGFSDIRALQIDHVHGGGTKERKNYGSMPLYRKILKEIKAGSKDYQLLCANCNWIKKYENKENSYIRSL